MAGASELLRCSQTRRPRPNNGDRLPRIDSGQDRFNITLIESTIDNVQLDDANRDRIFVDAEDTSPFTGRWAEPSCKLREIVCRMESLERIFPTATRG